MSDGSEADKVCAAEEAQEVRSKKTPVGHAAHREKLHGDREGVTMRRHVPRQFKYFITVNFYPGTANPGELFINIAKQGSDVSGLIESLAMTVSIALQYGVPWPVLRDKFLGTRFGMHVSQECPSLLDHIARTIDEAIDVRWCQINDIVDQDAT